MTLDGVSAASQANQFSVKVSEGQEDQHEKVVGKILEGVEESAPRALEPGKGGLVNTIG